ncbi:hypothetical protein MBANPS3_011199 [Mucor bainieri]
MISHNTQLKKLRFILFPPARFPCNSTSIHPDVKCSTRENHYSLNYEIKSSTHRYRPHSTGSTSDCQEKLKVKEAQPRPSLSSSVTTKVNQEHKECTQSQITTCSTTFAQQENCPTLIQSSSSCVIDGTFDHCTLPNEIRKRPIYDHPNHHDTREIASSIRRCVLPFKVHYELEWPMLHYTSNAVNKKIWLQLDDQTSSGIERVRKLGFTDLDVRLDDQLTHYINSLTGSKDDSVVIQILFDNNFYDENSQHAPLNGKQSRLLRLRRVHWWSISYNLARTWIPIHP